ncbi:MAG: antibiotic biosynthesis monooxygenase family protein [Propionibacteriaceae bacterium]
MIVVNGSLQVAPEAREAYLDTCREVVSQARVTPGCVDFAISADLLEPGRINILEQWDSRSALDAFRGEGTGDEQTAMILSASVVEHEVATTTRLS